MAIVEDLNELENLGAGFIPRTIPPVMDQLVFQCAEEALDRRIVIAIAFATHAGDEPVVSEHGPIHRTRVLRALIRAVTDHELSNVPEPGTIALFATGLLGLALARRKAKHRH